MAIRKPIQYQDNPDLQYALRVQEQRNPNAAIKGLGARGLYSRWAGNIAANELSSKKFANALSLRERDLAETNRRHSLTNAMEVEKLNDAVKGSKIAQMLGLGSMGVSWYGNRKDTQERTQQKQLQLLGMSSQQLQDAYTMGLYTNDIEQTPWFKRNRVDLPTQL